MTENVKDVMLKNISGAKDEKEMAKCLAVYFRSGLTQKYDSDFYQTVSDYLSKQSSSTFMKHFADFIRLDDFLASEIWYGSKVSRDFDSVKFPVIFKACAKKLGESFERRYMMDLVEHKLSTFPDERPSDEKERMALFLENYLDKEKDLTDLTLFRLGQQVSDAPNSFTIQMGVKPVLRFLGDYFFGKRTKELYLKSSNNKDAYHIYTMRITHGEDDVIRVSTGCENAVFSVSVSDKYFHQGNLVATVAYRDEKNPSKIIDCITFFESPASSQIFTHLKKAYPMDMYEWISRPASNVKYPGDKKIYHDFRQEMGEGRASVAHGR